MNEANPSAIPTCLLCGGTTVEPSAVIARDYVYDNPGTWSYAECRSCGSAFQNPPIPEDEISRFYPDTYYTGMDFASRGMTRRLRIKQLIARRYYGYTQIQSMTAMEIVYWPAVWLLARAKGAARLIESRREGRVLDVGCGNGQQLDLYRDLGWQTCGVDISPRAVEVCRRHRHEAHEGTLFTVRLEPESFDAVVLWDALEHIACPRETMAECRRVLRPGGRVYISVPNYNSWWARFFRDRWYMFTAPVHYVQYTERGLAALLEGSGFRVCRFWHPLGDVGLAGTFAGIAKKSGRLGSVLWKAAAALTAKLDYVLPRGHITMVAERSEKLPMR